MFEEESVLFDRCPASHSNKKETLSLLKGNHTCPWQRPRELFYNTRFVFSVMNWVLFYILVFGTLFYFLYSSYCSFTQQNSCLPNTPPNPPTSPNRRANQSSYRGAVISTVRKLPEAKDILVSMQIIIVVFVY